MVRRNIIANYLGSFWTALMGLAFVPLYIKFMGIEAYGLIGFFGTLVSLFSILDMGLSATLSREMAIRSSLPEKRTTMRDLLRTIETIYWGVAVLIGAGVILLSFPIAAYWVNPEKLTTADVQQAVMIMGLVVILRWPFGLYQGGLMGLQRQVLANVINCAAATIRGGGAVLVLWLISPTVQAFFCFQIVMSALETLTMAFFLWKSMPQDAARPVFRTSMLIEVKAFAIGMMGISVVALILTQSDKILLSKLLPLDMYGYYMLAWTVAGSLGKVCSPIFQASYPKFVSLAAQRDETNLVHFYHKTAQLIAVVVLPPAMVLSLFSYQALLVWTANTHIAETAHLVLSLLVIGTAANGLMHIPYAAQLAYGWTSLGFWVNAVSVLILAPALYVLVSFYGMIGGGIAWAALNIGYIFLSLPLVHRRILKKELWRWYRADFGLILISVAVPIMALGKLLVPHAGASALFMVIVLAFISLVAFLAAVCSASELRPLLLSQALAFWGGLRRWMRLATGP